METTTNPNWAQVQLFVLKNKNVEPSFLIEEKLQQWISDQANDAQFRQQLLYLIDSMRGTKEATGNGWHVLYNWFLKSDNWPIRGKAIMPEDEVKKIYYKFLELWPDDLAFLDFRCRLVKGAKLNGLIPKGSPGQTDKYTNSRRFIKAFSRHVQNNKAYYDAGNVQTHFKQNFGVRSTDNNDLTAFSEFFDAFLNG